MIVSPVNLQQQVVLVDECFDGFWFYLGGEVGASPADFAEQLHCVQLLLRDLTGHEKSDDSGLQGPLQLFRVVVVAIHPAIRNILQSIDDAFDLDFAHPLFCLFLLEYFAHLFCYFLGKMEEIECEKRRTHVVE